MQGKFNSNLPVTLSARNPYHDLNKYTCTAGETNNDLMIQRDTQQCQKLGVAVFTFSSTSREEDTKSDENRAPQPPPTRYIVTVKVNKAIVLEAPQQQPNRFMITSL